MTDTILLSLFLVILLVIAVNLCFSNKPYHSVILLSAYSLISTLIFTILQAPDVALTECAIGVCISTAIVLVSCRNFFSVKLSFKPNILAALTCLIFFAVLCYLATLLPSFGNSLTVVHNNSGVEYYLANTVTEIGLESYVASILASYRAFDTFGETVVIFTSAAACILVLKEKKNA